MHDPTSKAFGGGHAEEYERVTGGVPVGAAGWGS
jgi:hypothetical protein